MKPSLHHFLSAIECNDDVIPICREFARLFPIKDLVFTYHDTTTVLLPGEVDEKDKRCVATSSTGAKLTCHYAKYEDEEKLHACLELLLLKKLQTEYQSFMEEARYIQMSTGYLNGFGFTREINKRYKKKDLIDNFTLVSCNIKGFGLLNRKYSILHGDIAIRQVAKTIISKLLVGEIFCHVGGDSFIALVHNEHLSDFVREISDIELDIQSPDESTKAHHHFGLRIGAIPIDAQFDMFQDYISPSMLALGYAKANKLNYVLLHRQLREEIERSKFIEQTIDDEIRKKHFLVYYQPKVDTRTGQIIGAEALARWKYAGKIIPPGLFVPILEKNGDILKLDLYILNAACHDISHYKKLGNKTVPLSCNISRADLRIPNIKEIVVQTIQKYGLDFEDIVIEVTETTDLEEKILMQDFLSYLKSHDVKTSIDDFGTGYSSLATLRDFDVAEIKIDRSFINRETFEKSDEIIISSIIDMARKLGINVICEGVENQRQVELLSSFGCYQAQGYLYDQPLPKDKFEARLHIGFYPKADAATRPS
ncbi:MAG: EAL domain-containing protein [Bacilli bacterium]|nr:EAL domain-containing protein [Bacilli bacterium]